MKSRLLQATFALSLILGVAGIVIPAEQSQQAKGKEKKAAETVVLSDLPAPVRAVIEKLTAGGKIKKIEKAEENGKVVYDVEARVKGRDVEYDIASDGTVLTRQESVPYASLPAAVRAAAEKYFGTSKGLKAAKEVENGKNFYEVEGKKGGIKITLKLTETGQIVEEEKG